MIKTRQSRLFYNINSIWTPHFPLQKSIFHYHVKIYYEPWTNHHSPNQKVSGKLSEKHDTWDAPTFYCFVCFDHDKSQPKYCTAGIASLPWLQQQGASRRSTQTNPCLINEILSHVTIIVTTAEVCLSAYVREKCKLLWQSKTATAVVGK